MKQSQIDFLIQNNYKIVDNKIINNLSDYPPIEIIFDETINKFCLGIRMLKIYDNDFEDFLKLFNEHQKLINILNSL